MNAGVVVMAYGTPASADDLVAYYTHIRRGRPPSDEQVAELRSRYDAIGGMSPLRRVLAFNILATTHKWRTCWTMVSSIRWRS